MSSSWGGAVYINTNNIYYLLIERSTFVKCQCSLEGGAIYSEFGNNVLHNVCGNDCHSDNWESFAAIGGSDSTETNTKNYVIQSSVANCEADSDDTMYHAYGHIQYKSVNLSDNIAQYSFSAIECYPNQKDENNDYGISISYSSFSNNTAETFYYSDLGNPLLKSSSWSCSTCTTRS